MDLEHTQNYHSSSNTDLPVSRWVLRSLSDEQVEDLSSITNPIRGSIFAGLRLNLWSHPYDGDVPWHA
jgi:hypothetical protein